MLQKQILSLPRNIGQTQSITKTDGLKLIVIYSETRAYNDSKNRKRAVIRLEKAIQKGKLTKEHINNRGYIKYKYLQLTGSAHKHKEVNVDFLSGHTHGGANKFIWHRCLFT